ncbi:hypothetical protein C0033_12955 [Clostridium sp. chh4-2]|uniref:hypothetical protein n=1 Tax=Clostridium sp. chh4-2 TaxID=2067550 RepID=UPI000CCEB557|nr:hypothetical protein [Clostridium sp. chh4-2]PNV61488.1 hypothetical protein C0033_12955 [Clostridium sp. chh4-2]
MIRTYSEIFCELNALSNLELVCRYKKMWFDVNVRDLYNVPDSDYSMDEDVLLNDIICSRFCNMFGSPVHVSCGEGFLNYDWIE